MSRKTWDEFFMDMAKLVASRSKDPSTKVGAVIVDPMLRVPVGMGYNGFPRGVNDTVERYCDRALKYEMVVHAEVNAILNAVRDVRGCTLYSTFMPCPQCAAQLIQAGVANVYALVNEADDRWKAKADITRKMFSEAGVTMYIVKEEKNAWDILKEVSDSVNKQREINEVCKGENRSDYRAIADEITEKHG